MQLLIPNYNEVELRGCVVDLSILTHYAEELVKFLFLSLDVQDHMRKTSKLNRLRAS